MRRPGASLSRDNWFYAVQPNSGLAVEVASSHVQQIKGVTGYIPVSTPEATATDLIVYARQAGGLDRVLTVLQELAEHPGFATDLADLLPVGIDYDFEAGFAVVKQELLARL